MASESGLPTGLCSNHASSLRDALKVKGHAATGAIPDLFPLAKQYLELWSQAHQMVCRLSVGLVEPDAGCVCIVCAHRSPHWIALSADAASHQFMFQTPVGGNA